MSCESTKQLLFNGQESRIWPLNEKTPVCGRGLMTTWEGDKLLKYAYHYNGIEIYFNSFSYLFEKKILLVVSINNFMEVHNV